MWKPPKACASLHTPTLGLDLAGIRALGAVYFLLRFWACGLKTNLVGWILSKSSLEVIAWKILPSLQSETLNFCDVKGGL